jgi:hypothetical protein
MKHRVCFAPSSPGGGVAVRVLQSMDNGAMARHFACVAFTRDERFFTRKREPDQVLNSRLYE